MSARRPTPLERELFGIKVLSAQHPQMKALRTAGEPSLHGQRPWSSTWLLLDYLEKISVEKNPNVLEIGCGWGFTSCYCAAVRGATVTALDVDAEVFKFVHEHARVNGCESRVKTVQGDFKELPTDLLRQTDIIVGADICFWDEMTDLLYEMIIQALRNGVKRIILADPGRDPFLALTRRCDVGLRVMLLNRTIRKPIYSDGYILVIEGEKSKPRANSDH